MFGECSQPFNEFVQLKIKPFFEDFVFEYNLSPISYLDYVYKIGKCQTNKHKISHFVYVGLVAFFIVRLLNGMCFLLGQDGSWHNFEKIDNFIFIIVDIFLHRSLYFLCSICFLAIYIIGIDVYFLYSNNYFAIVYEDYHKILPILNEFPLEKHFHAIISFKQKFTFYRLRFSPFLTWNQFNK